MYGQSPPRLLSYLAGTSHIESVDQELQTREQLLKNVRGNLLAGKNHMKLQYDSSHREVRFEIGDMVLLKLQPYRQIPHSSSHTSGRLHSFSSSNLDYRSHRGRSQILIHWEGLSPVEASWEDAVIIMEHSTNSSSGWIEFSSYLREIEMVDPEKSELDIYLEEGCHWYDPDEEFDVWSWWKLNTYKFRILYQL
ncbi:hypothetical protein ZIOFF_018743 [Zingiber officinale]|uniref:Chromo domain-containing protein n=1 Tax=Zingiber officinale TaxID=94328 RepID=A0A8J5HGT2_ZINOF|nr:hypothetical protein ZIOFF_018743 [Zingiber officinale]